MAKVGRGHEHLANQVVEDGLNSINDAYKLDDEVQPGRREIERGRIALSDYVPPVCFLRDTYTRDFH